jgi:hypothetical protein
MSEVKQNSSVYPAIKLTAGAGANKVNTVDSQGNTTLKILGSANITDGVVSQAKRGAANYQLSGSCGSFEQSTVVSWTDITNLSVSITVINRPVLLMLIHDGSGNTTNIHGSKSEQRLLQGSTEIYRLNCECYFPAGAVNLVWLLDAPGAGTYTYKLQYRITGAGGWYRIYYTKLLALEL